MKYEAIITLGNNEVIGWWRRTDIINDSTRTHKRATENHLIYLKMFIVQFHFDCFRLSDFSVQLNASTPTHANAYSLRRGRRPTTMITTTYYYYRFFDHVYGIVYLCIRQSTLIGICNGAHTRMTPKWSNVNRWPQNIYIILPFAIFSIYQRVQNASVSLRACVSVWTWMMSANHIMCRFAISAENHAYVLCPYWIGA